MDKDKFLRHVGGFLRLVLVLLSITFLTSLEIIKNEKLLLVPLMFPAAILLYALLRLQGHKIFGSSLQKIIAFLTLFLCLFPFLYFYRGFPDNWYFFIMSLTCGFVYSFFLASLCAFCGLIGRRFEDEQLVNESIIIARILQLLPFLVLGFFCALLHKMGFGLDSLILYGRWRLVGWFPIVMMITAISPIMLILRVLRTINKLEECHD